MTITENNGTNYSDADIERIKDEASTQGYNRGQRLGLDSYKRQLAESILQYAKDYDLCEDGVSNFCRDNDIPFKSDHEVTVTITFTLKGILGENEAEDRADNYARSITEASFMESHMDYATIECENYNVEVE